MPKRKKSNLSSRPAKARAMASLRERESFQERQVRLQKNAETTALQRFSETSERRQARLQTNANRIAYLRSQETPQQRLLRREEDSGQVYHRIGSLLPPSGKPHSFLQIYFIGDQDIETDTRCNNIPGVCRTTVEDIQQMFHEENQLVRSFKTAMELLPTDNYKVVIRADRRPPGEHERRYNAPTADEVAIVIAGNEFESRDIVLRKRDGNLLRVSETHRFYDALQYPLIFSKGQEGYHFGIPMMDPNTNLPTNKKVSSMDFYAYMLMVREDDFNTILRYRQLLNQFIVDMYAKIETERLLYIKLNQKKLRAESYVHLRDALNNDATLSANDIGQSVILPSSFVGSPRYLSERAQDALTYVKNYGRPDLFITLTCNPKWPEILESLLPGQKATDRHDIVSRVFHQKIKIFVAVINKGEVFGSVRCFIYTVEWQKRGLPHIHYLLWLCEKIRPNQIDSVISSEIPERTSDPVLHEYVLKHMVHGPCGAYNQRSPCMKDGKCTKHYPRPLIENTQTNDDGYPMYRRRSPHDGGFTGHINMKAAGNVAVEIDNRWIVPYCPTLIKIFNAHINVEYCSSVKAINYVCKYIHKGSDQAAFNLVKGAQLDNLKDEVTIYQTGRYLSSNEAAWRIFGFPVHERKPTVTHLSVHLENGQRVYFNEENMNERLQNPPPTTLTAFFDLCQNDDFAKTLLYHEVPHYFTFNATEKVFRRRIQGTPVHGYADVKYSDALGRVYTVHPANFECYCLRLLLHKVRGPTSFQQLRTANNQICGTYREACQALGLLENDNHWESTMEEAVLTRSASRVRHLFAILISTCELSSPITLWESFRNDLSDDILHRHREVVPDLQYNDIVYNEALTNIQELVKSMSGKDLSSFGLPAPNLLNGINPELLKEMAYNIDDMQLQVQEMLPKLLPEQQVVYDTILERIESRKGGIIFLDAPGGTGKTFLITLILAKLRKENHIALAIASSGIASTLLPGGRTAHSALKLPLNLATAETTQCNISKTSDRAEVLRRCTLLVWDECTMSHKRAFEALNATLQDIRNSQDLMGGLVVLLSGDFGQTLPVIQRGTPADEINSCLKKSVLWSHIEQYHLVQNMRVSLHNDCDARQFSGDLLKIGEGRMKTDQHKMISFPENFGHMVASAEELIASVFPDLQNNHYDPEWLSCRAILAPKNDDVNKINSKIMNIIHGEVKSYLSIDSITEEEQALHYPVEFLNTLELPVTMPPRLSPDADFTPLEAGGP
ncbi:uncharacterized protein LOC129003620 [Macrosteles quadrilineatus]|uniref:uncharacterized protein LOC129003620 n=1 Tax=Macrosteles quadrilineatus TaxID=74068 RepID=UPI0023E2CC8D|nr:uncharacterized protein LOC129003620 [Macrosteles quadrilineatus]